MELKVDGRKVYAATGGRPFDPAKPAVIFIHGAGQDHTNWQLPSRWFAWHGHAALAPDLPGHGRSDGPPLETIGDMAQWIGRLMDAAGIKTAGLVGHSMGGGIAVEAAAALPDRIPRIVLLGTSLSMPVNDALLTAARDAPEKAHHMITGWAHGPRAKVGGNPVPGLWMSGGSMALLGRNRPGTLYAAFNACNLWKTGPDAAARVRCPTLVLIGASDAMTPPKIGRALADKIAGSRTVVIPGSGHMMMYEAPDAVLDELIAFFAQVEAA
jgi:pimeloyl-ACP methyl ester carboxylesterase